MKPPEKKNKIQFIFPSGDGHVPVFHSSSIRKRRRTRDKEQQRETVRTNGDNALTLAMEHTQPIVTEINENFRQNKMFLVFGR